jgi:hypothetical protein
VKSIFIDVSLRLVRPLAAPLESVQQAQKNPPGGGLLVSSGSFVIDLVCAQLHLPGSGRMMMMVHVVEANEHDERA